LLICKSFLFLLSGLLAGFIAGEIRETFSKWIRSMEERNEIIHVFGQHVSPAVVNRLLAQKAGMESEVRFVCLMFLDIRNFTTFSETRTPAEVVNYLNTLFEFMIDDINRHNGIINKFLGDGFMAVFGAPLSDGQECRNAVAAAIEIIAKVEELSASGRIPPTRIGIGLHAGEAVTGNVGSPQRKEYTIIGDAVNLASRIEQLNKQFNSQLLVSESVWDNLAERTIEAVALDPIQVKGRQAPVQIFKLA
jgi:adenylate cyclase